MNKGLMTGALTKFVSGVVISALPMIKDPSPLEKEIYRLIPLVW